MLLKKLTGRGIVVCVLAGRDGVVHALAVGRVACVLVFDARGGADIAIQSLAES